MCPLCSKIIENLIHEQLFNRIFYKNDLISRYICLLLLPQGVHFNTNEGLDYVILNGWPFNDTFASIIFNIFCIPSPAITLQQIKCLIVPCVNAGLNTDH
jgi:hypothetical protein